MHYVSVEGLTKSYGINPLFNNISFNINEGDKIALIARNGVGKSTLLKILAGQETPDSGKFWINKEVTVALFEQDPVFDEDKTIVENIFKANHPIIKAIQKYELAMEAEDGMLISDSIMEMDDLGAWDFEAKVKQILGKLNIHQLQKKVNELSGGQRKRVALAKTLIDIGFEHQHTLLMMDEPTNHLDLPSIEWLENYLSGYPGSVIIVSHDREFLNKMINKTAELSNNKLYLWDGNYDFYLQAKVERDDLIGRQAANQEQYIKEQEKFINRFKAKASKAKAVQSRVKMVEKIEKIEVIQEDKSNLKIDFKVGKQSGKVVMELNKITQGFNNKLLFDDVNREIVRGDKIALIGANGTGKSTFLSIIADELPFTGERKQGHNVVPSFYAQHQLESLHMEYEILEELQYDAPHKTDMELRSMLGCFLFAGDDVFKKVKVLSGGEKARVSLAKTLVSEANFLLLDEPTNHLDIDSIEIIIEALKRYEGTLIFVSHNRYFIEKLANKVWWIEDEEVKEYPGTYHEYNYKLEQDKLNPPKVEVRKKTSVSSSENSVDSKNTWKQKDEKIEQVKKLQKQLDGKEEQLKNAKSHGASLEAKLAEAANLTPEDFESLSKEYAASTASIKSITTECDALLEATMELED